MDVPGEVLFDIVQWVDYVTLYSLTFVDKQIHDVGVRNAEKLAKRRNFALTFTETALQLVVDGSIQLPPIALDDGTAPLLLKALQEVASVVGFHAVTKLVVAHGDWLRLPIAEIFALLPALEYATTLHLRYAPPDGAPSAADYVVTFVANFSQLHELVLALHRLFDWTYLRRDSALKLATLKVHVRCQSQSSEQEVIRYYETVSRRAGNEAKSFALMSPFLTDRLLQEEVERVVEVLSKSQRVLTLLLPTGAHLQLPQRNFLTVAINNKHGKISRLFTFRRANVAVGVIGNGFTTITNDPKCFPA